MEGMTIIHLSNLNQGTNYYALQPCAKIKIFSPFQGMYTIF